MVTGQKDPQSVSRRGLIAGNYCHDVLKRDGAVVAETLGGAASFISAVFDGLGISCNLVSKVGADFAYATNHAPIVVPISKTTMFHAHFDSRPDGGGDGHGDGHGDRVLRRVCACEPIGPSDLPDARFDFGMAVGVGGEILPETLEKMVGICNVVFVDIQALIRVFDGGDGTVKLVALKDSGFAHLLPRIGFLKASAEEALFMDVEEVRKLCCVVVTKGKDGCKVLWKDGELQIAPFSANQVDPTGAGDSFLGGFAAGLVQGLAVPDAALLGNYYGSITVSQVGIPKFDTRMLKRVKDELQRRKMQYIDCHERRDNGLKFMKPPGHDQFHSSLFASKLLLSVCPGQERHWDRPNSPRGGDQDIPCHYAVQPKLIHSSVYDEPIQTVDSKP